MTVTALEKLSKVLALADSGHDGEAMAALHAARRLLRTDGVNLSDVLQEALDDRQNYVQVRGGIVNALQRDVIAMQVRLSEMHRDLREQQKETQHWKKLAEENTRKLKTAAADNERLRQITRTMATQLSGMLQALEDEEKILMK